MATSPPRKSMLDLVNECDSFPHVDIPSLAHSDTAEGSYYAFCLPGDAQPHGFVPASVVAQMPWTADFAVSPPGELPRTVRLLDASGGSATAEACNASLRDLVARTREKGVFLKTLGRKAEGEDFRIMGARAHRGRHGAPVVRLRRSAAPLLGIANRGAHMTMYTRAAAASPGGTGGYRFWVARRSRHLATYPGMLDNTVAGGVRADESPLACVVHESEEEASLPADFVRRHVRAVGTVTYVTQTGSGGGTDRQAAVGGFDAGLCVPDVLYCYDLEVPAGQAEAVVPTPGDDEVEQFYLWDLATTREAMARGEFKPNTALVLLDFFVRHGIITEDNEPDYVEIVSRLHRRLPVPTAAPSQTQA